MEFGDEEEIADRFIEAFGASLLARYSIHGLHVTAQWLAVNEQTGCVMLYITIDDGKVEDVQLMLDRIFFNPREPAERAVDRLATALDIPALAARERLYAANVL